MSIPITDTLNIIEDHVNNNYQFTRKMTIPEDKFLDLVNLVLATTWCTFNSKFYQQTGGVAMGGLASTKAEQFEHIFTALHPPKVYYGNVLRK